MEKNNFDVVPLMTLSPSSPQEEKEKQKQIEADQITVKETLKSILQNAVPTIISMFSALFVEVINTAFVGHLGNQAMMAGVGMANMFINITGLSTIMGINATMNTLVSQSYGMGNYKMCGLYLNRARIVITIIYIPIILLLLNTETIFDVIGFDPEASHYSQIYVNLFIPGLYLAGLVDCNRRFLNNMEY